MKARRLHPWRVSCAEAVAWQVRLRRRLRLVPPARPPRLVAGADVAYSAATHRMYAAVVLVELPGLRVMETARGVTRARFPYLPGLFTFRELPPLLRAFARLRGRPQALLFDGHGLAHPRRFGLACHAGLLLRTPAVGCAKSRLVGEHDPPGPRRGDGAPLRVGEETVGVALRTREGVAPVFVSPGHRADLDFAVDLVLRSTSRYRLPEPIRLAHAATRDLMRRLDPGAPRARRRDYPDFVG